MKAAPADRALVLRKLAATRSSAVFAGPRGSGKTKAAQEVASSLGVALRRVDLGGVVGRYIGETEKNIDRLFADAARDGAVLLFDEADALFGKRTDVGDAHDRYANTAADYLLAKIEAHSGVAILASNGAEAMDPGVVRRLGTALEFHSATDPRAAGSDVNDPPLEDARPPRRQEPKPA